MAKVIMVSGFRFLVHIYFDVDRACFEGCLHIHIKDVLRMKPLKESV